MSKGREYNSIRLGITREIGTLNISENKIEWNNRDGSIKHIVKSDEIKEISWLSVDNKNKMMKILFSDKTKSHLRFIGFGNEDEYEIDNILRQYIKKPLKPKEVFVKGWNWGEFILRNHELSFRSDDKKTICTVPLDTINQSVLQGKNEVALEFNLSKTQSVSKRSDQLMEMRIYIPDDGTDEKTEAYEEFHKKLLKKAGLQQDKSQIIARFENISFRVPRGKYEIQFYKVYFRFRGPTFSYKIDFKQIKRLFIFRQPDLKMAFLISLNPPIRQGQTTYYYLIMECPENETTTVPINLSEEEIKKKYVSKNGIQLLNKETKGPTYDVLSRVFMSLSTIKVIQAKNFKSSDYSGNESCIRCSLGANSGLLYPLEKSMFFIWKPPTYIRHSEIDRVEFARIHESNQIKMFDFVIHHKKEKKFLFTGIDKHEYEPLVSYIINHPSIKLVDRAMHASRINSLNNSNNNKLGRGNRRRNNNTSFANTELIDDESDEEDDDYNMEEDEEQLVDDERDDERYEELASGELTLTE